MKLGAECVLCMIQSNWKRVENYPPNVRDEYMLALIRIMDNAGERSATGLVPEVHALRERLLGRAEDDFTEIKHQYNTWMLERMSELRARIAASADPLLEALRLAMAANYIDFSAVKDVNTEKLMELLDATHPEEISPGEYAHFLEDLSCARSLVYCTDNCGEIVLDRLVLEAVQKRFPHVRRTVIVRGGPVANDATAQDALEVGLDCVAQILPSGAAIGGTEISYLSEPARRALEEADLIVAKGQGNFETLSGCGWNIYYLFLCKCAMFTAKFGMERFRGVFANERRLEKHLAH